MKAEMKERVVLALVRVLAWRNGLEGFMSALAILWGISALSFPAYWSQSCAGGMRTWSITPGYLGWTLVLTGLIGVASLAGKWRYLRMQSSVVAFIVWGLMAVWSFQSPPVPVADDVAVYSAFAVAELVIYVRILTGLDPTTKCAVDSIVGLGRRRSDQQSRSDDDAGDH